MKDFPFWRGAIYNAKTALILKAVGEELANFQNQSDFLTEGNKLTEAEVATLRTQYAGKMKILTDETLLLKSPGKPKFNKLTLNPPGLFILEQYSLLSAINFVVPLPPQSYSLE